LGWRGEGRKRWRCWAKEASWAAGKRKERNGGLVEVIKRKWIFPSMIFGI
jgi:hypothetical protein